MCCSAAMLWLVHWTLARGPRGAEPVPLAKAKRVEYKARGGSCPGVQLAPLAPPRSSAKLAPPTVQAPASLYSCKQSAKQGLNQLW